MDNKKHDLQVEYDILRNKIYDLLFEFGLKLKESEKQHENERV